MGHRTVSKRDEGSRCALPGPVLLSVVISSCAAWGPLHRTNLSKVLGGSQDEPAMSSHHASHTFMAGGGHSCSQTRAKCLIPRSLLHLILDNECIGKEEDARKKMPGLARVGPKGGIVS
jgi:hypothetical protein